jgi:hypothetical protein
MDGRQHREVPGGVDQPCVYSSMPPGRIQTQKGASVEWSSSPQVIIPD